MNNQSSSPLVESRKHQHNRVKGTQSTKTTHVLLPYLHKLGEEQFNLNFKKQIGFQQKQVGYSKLLVVKKEGAKQIGDQNDNIKEKGQESKPSQQLNKNYSSHSRMQKAEIKVVDTPIIRSRQQQGHNNSEYKGRILPPKAKRRQQFNKQSNRDQLKQQQKPSSNKAYRIKRVQNQNSKLLRDAFISLNQQQNRLQSQILQLHKNSIKLMREISQDYGITFNIDKLSSQFTKDYNKQIKNIYQSAYGQMLLLKMQQRIKISKKQLIKTELKIQKNDYLKYLVNTPQGIEEMNQSEEEDEVDELIPSQLHQPKIDINQSSYSTVMRSIKDKRHGLNLRRTYEVFKPLQKSCSNYEKLSQNKQISTENGQNIITINKNLKDFLLG